MALKGFVLNIVIVSIIEVLASIFLPEGRMKKFVVSIISMILFFAVVFPLCEFINSSGFENGVFEWF